MKKTPADLKMYRMHTTNHSPFPNWIPWGPEEEEEGEDARFLYKT